MELLKFGTIADIHLKEMNTNHKHVEGVTIKTPPSTLMAPATVKAPSTAIYHKQLIHASKLMLSEREQECHDIFVSFFDRTDMQARLKAQKCGKLKKVKGRTMIQPVPMKVMETRERKTQKLEHERAEFLAGSDSIITGKTTTTEVSERCMGQKVSFRSPFYKRTVKRSTPKRTGKTVKCDVASLTHKVMKISAQRHISVEIVGKKNHRCTYVKIDGNTLPRLQLKHMDGIRVRQELKRTEWNAYIEFFSKYTKIRSIMHDHAITHGWSGLIIPGVFVKGYNEHENVVVRGRLYGKIVDARHRLSYWNSLTIAHYSSNEKQFFDGWMSAFTKMSPEEQQHLCQVNKSNFYCGQLAATIVQALFPCHKLSCDMCRHRIEDLTDGEYGEVIKAHMEKRTEILKEMIADHPSVGRLTKGFKQAFMVNPNMKDCLEVQRITQNKEHTHLLLMNKLNAILMKGNLATPEEFSRASEITLEITRWFKNHLNLVSAGSLDAFRNKATSKALMNPALMCDNQLDQNGNFVWGERGYHAKRFFNNYFEEVKPGDGYERYIIRKNPHGSRKLAIGNLIVPVDLERARKLLSGEDIDRQVLSEECVSRQDGSFIYTCCCVTNDVGQPLLSDVKHPTKRHLVIGATGDPKLVDLPTIDAEKMYIAKEGYCYLNVFLAMLINVDAGHAKEFTKMVRDTLVPSLEQWPTMFDLATACFILTVFFPETANAELPRILVDHKTQTMHVIDSFGSLTKGYHILKAGTVSQLIKFASNDLKSSMKLYRVGGMPRRERMETLLIRSIYKPKDLLYLIYEEPYILLMSLVSPRLLKEMFHNGHFEIAMKHWINKDQSLSVIFSMLEMLAGRVSRSTMFAEQITIIGEECKQLYEIYSTRQLEGSIAIEIKELMNILVERTRVDDELQKIGYYNHNMRLYEMREKIYCDRLDAEWHELSLFQKSCAIISLCKRRSKLIQSEGKKNETIVLEGKWHICRSWLHTRSRQVLDTTRKSISRRITCVISCVRRYTIDTAIDILMKCYSDLIYFVNVMAILAALSAVITNVCKVVHEHRQMKLAIEQEKCESRTRQMVAIYDLLVKEGGQQPTIQEMHNRISLINPKLLEEFEDEVYNKNVIYQGKSKGEMGLEKIIAVMALITMIYDTEKSDAVFKILSKIKTVFGTLGEEVRYQSLDDIQSLEDDKKMTIDFDLETDTKGEGTIMDTRFSAWWQKQLDQNRVVPHYREGGNFLEFSRATSSDVCIQIHTSTEREFMIRGAVGSGKSTGLPYGLSKRGRILVLEPTRPLAENVCKQLRKDPFHAHPTLRMRGVTAFGSDNITIMTSGFALHFYANNPQRLKEIDFIMIDECHVVDASTMAFYCLMKEYEYTGKILKVSATPPGKECEFKTQHSVKLHMEDEVSFTNFVSAQGTQTAIDVTQHGDNILVYVASYNEVDTLSKMLIEKRYHVTKVDGRTMKVGSVEIPTVGTPNKKHFVVATNIIENGVTLDIEVVVDFGTKVVAELDNDCRCMRYKKVPISYGERLQRVGRVGRVKPGAALRIGHTEKDATGVPMSIATEAAFLCFAYGLPVMTYNVSTTILSNCTVKQAKTIMHFELPPFYMVDFVRHNGTMHPLIHQALKGYKLRDSEIELSTLAIPSAAIDRWKTVGDYKRMGVHIECDERVRVSFATRGIPDKLYGELWQIVTDYKRDSNFGRLTSACASKVSYTLSTEPTAIPRTLTLIDRLIQEEKQKNAHFEALSDTMCSQSFTLMGMVSSIRSRYMTNHSAHNIEVLQMAKAQIREFSAQTMDYSQLDGLINYGFLETVQYQSKEEICKCLGLKGKWNHSLMTKDIFISVMTMIGGLWMLWEYFKKGTDVVQYQGKKRKTQRLKFRDARDKKVGREVYGDDGEIEHHFGEAYTKRGKVKGSSHTKGMGRKTRRFIHMYGFDPADYSFVRFVDPVSGVTLEERVTVDIHTIQDEITEARNMALEFNEDLYEFIRNVPGIQAYYIPKIGKEALKIDLTPHNPLAVCKNTATVAGFPEREFELRQTGKPVMVNLKDVPEVSEGQGQRAEESEVGYEGKSIIRGLRNYNPIATSVCRIINDSEGVERSIHGIGFGPVIITNGHLFKRNNGSLLIQSHHGEYTISNSTQIPIHHVEGKDMIIIRLPKDFPPFPMRLKFRAPQKEERAVLVGSIFQQKSITSCVSESTMIAPTKGDSYWKHWVTTKEGDCGLPLVATRDGEIIGFHGLTSSKADQNYFIPFVDDFRESVLDKLDLIEWKKHWRHTSDKIAWGGLTLKEDVPDLTFRMSKIISDLCGREHDEVTFQSREDKWLYANLHGNLKAVAQSTSQLVTKHTVKGPCLKFQEYLSSHDEAERFFRPKMGFYKASRLNRDAYKKDFFKYAGPVNVGVVDHDIFMEAVQCVITMMREVGFGECKFVTDSDEIFSSLNQKAAVGAMYQGKKKEYLEGLSTEDRDALLFESCKRLYKGQMGIWNGSLKAELRPLEKVEANKTRTFTAAPIDTLLGGKVCVDDFNNMFYALNLEGPWSVGMTKFYGGWNDLLMKLPEGWIYCDADGSQFDSSLTPYLINAVVLIREEFMEKWDEGLQMLRNFYTEIVYTPILTPDGTIVKKFKGNNSGQPSTVVDNTLMVVITMYYSMLKFGMKTEEIKDSVRFFANGDDLIISVKPEREELLNQLQEHFLELGLKYDFSERHTKREDLWFMSHRGLVHNNMYIPKLEEERIVSILEWDRSTELAHRSEAICAAMIEAWGYPELLREIRKFYLWLMEKSEFKDLALEGKMPYIAESALVKLYTNTVEEHELIKYWYTIANVESDETDEVRYQAGDEEKEKEKAAEEERRQKVLDAGYEKERKEKEKQITKPRDKDLDAGSSGIIPRINKISKIRIPKVNGAMVLNFEHLISYKPEQINLSNTRATTSQFETWYNGMKESYEVTDEQMHVLLNGLMVWCIENGTSPNINGTWVMMDGDDQVEYQLKPVIENAKPTFRQIMHHFSDAAEAYIEMRNMEKPYMPRYGLQRNLRDRTLARYAFDFYEVTSQTPDRAREAIMQMKAAALSNATSRLFGLDGNVATVTEDTERHTATDVNQNMHSLMGVRGSF